MRCGIYVRVSTDDQRDNGYSIDSQLRMIKEHCEKNEYDIIDIYNDAGHSGKDLMRPEMQRLLKDIKSSKLDKLIAIIDKETWDKTRCVLEKNKHPNYGEHIHLFTSLVKCPECGNILSSTLSYKNSGTPKQKDYYFLTCKNPNCKSKGLHYNCDKIEKKLVRVLNELTRYMYDNSNEVIVSNSKKSKEINDIEKAIDKLKLQEKRLVDLYLSSSLNVEVINQKNENIKKEITKLTNKRESMFPEDDNKEYTVELLKKLNCKQENDVILFPNDFAFTNLWDSLNKKSKKEMINRFISSLEIERDKNYNIEIKNIKFTDELISKSSNEYLEYLNDILLDNQMGIIYKEKINEQKRKELSKKYLIFSVDDLIKNDNPTDKLRNNITKFTEHFYNGGIISCPYVEDNNVIDNLILVPKN